MREARKLPAQLFRQAHFIDFGRVSNETDQAPYSHRPQFLCRTGHFRHARLDVIRRRTDYEESALTVPNSLHSSGQRAVRRHLDSRLSPTVAKILLWRRAVAAGVHERISRRWTAGAGRHDGAD